MKCRILFTKNARIVIESFLITTRITKKINKYYFKYYEASSFINNNKNFKIYNDYIIIICNIIII